MNGLQACLWRYVVGFASLWLLSAGVLAGNADLSELQLSGVSVSPSALPRASEATATVSFNLNQPANVVLEIYDAYDRRVYHKRTDTLLDAGDHTLRWRGVSDEGKPVPLGAYYYVLLANAADGRSARYDLSDITGGKVLKVEDIRYLADEGVVSYTVPSTSRLFIRYGIEDNVMLGTLVNGKVHLPGEYRIPWKGYDASGSIKLSGHPKLEFFVHGMQLSRNVIVVQGEEPKRPIFDTQADSVVTRVAGLKPAGLNVHAYHKQHLCRDFSITLGLIDKTGDGGVPVVKGRTRFRVAVVPEDLAVVESQRFEIQFYLDNQMVYENEVSYTPYNWTWDMSHVPPGVHHLTAIVVGYGSHFGVSTMEFRVDG